MQDSEAASTNYLGKKLARNFQSKALKHMYEGVSWPIKITLWRQSGLLKTHFFQEHFSKIVEEIVETINTISRKENFRASVMNDLFKKQK